MSGSVGTAVGSEPLYGTTVNHFVSSADSPKICPTIAAFSALSVIWPRHAAVTHSLLRPTRFATSPHFGPSLSACLALIAVWGLIGLAVLPSRAQPSTRPGARLAQPNNETLPSG